MRISARVTVIVDGVGDRLPRAPVGLFLGPVPSGGPLAATLSDDDGTCTLAAEVGAERAHAAGSIVCAAVLVPIGEVVGASLPVRLGRRPARLSCNVPAAAASRLPRPTAPAPAYAQPRPLVHGPIRVEPYAKRASVGAQVLELTPTERALLELFAAHPERAFSRLELLRSIWNSHHEGYARNVDCHVARLRRKIAAAGLSPAPIRTVRGTGYAFTPGID